MAEVVKGLVDGDAERVVAAQFARAIDLGSVALSDPARWPTICALTLREPAVMTSWKYEWEEPDPSAEFPDVVVVWENVVQTFWKMWGAGVDLSDEAAVASARAEGLREYLDLIEAASLDGEVAGDGGSDDSMSMGGVRQILGRDLREGDEARYAVLRPLKFLSGVSGDNPWGLICALTIEARVGDRP